MGARVRTPPTATSSFRPRGGGDPQVAVAASILPGSRHTPDNPSPSEGRGKPGGKPGTREGGGTRREGRNRVENRIVGRGEERAGIGEGKESGKRGERQERRD